MPQIFTPQPADVINTRPEPHSLGWKILHPKSSVPAWGIQTYQRAQGFRVWDETHTMVFFDEEHILSFTDPHCIWEPWEVVRNRLWRCYRPVFRLDDSDLVAMRWAADQMIGRDYDRGQLIDIALNGILHYNVSAFRRFFDEGANQLVCSVAGRTLFEHARKVKEEAGREPPFRVLFEKDGKKLNVERTPPACFSNTPRAFLLEAALIGRAA